jgi:hypothetical protein
VQLVVAAEVFPIVGLDWRIGLTLGNALGIQIFLSIIGL